DDQFEFSTLSKPSSTSSMDSTTNITNSNGSVVNTKTPFNNDIHSGNKSTLRRYAR
ncbi:unnamed protein product, partial [Rotaria magnacalcarata]